MPSTTELPPLYVLDSWDKLFIIGLAGVLVFTVGILVFCALSPLCCLYHICVCRDREKEKQATSGMDYGSTGGQYLTPYYTPEKPAIRQPWQAVKDTDTSDWSDYSSHDVIEMKQDRHQKETFFKPIRSEPQSPTASADFLYEAASLGFGLMYDRIDGKLTIRIQNLNNFSSADPDGAMTPYIKVRLYRAPRSFFTFKSSREYELNNLDVEFQTKILRRSIQPVFNELFIVPIDANEIHHYTLKLLVCDFDRYTRHVTIGEVVVSLSKVEWTTQTEVTFDEPLQPPMDEDLGELQLGLMYLPTSEKLSITIMKAQELKTAEHTKGDINTCFKITLMYDGRPMKKAKTTVRKNDANPIFNETMTFDVPQYQLDNVYFIITALQVDEEGDNASRSLIGRLYIGMNFDTDARAQWTEMVQNARKQVACWHKLQI